MNMSARLPFTWTPEVHRIRGFQTRMRITTVLSLVAHDGSQMSRLPPELLFEIFGFLSQFQAEAPARFVCDEPRLGLVFRPTCTTDLVFIPCEKGVATFARDGEFVGFIGENERGRGRWRGVAVAGDRLFAADFSNNRIIVFSIADGVYLHHFDTLQRAPMDVAVSDGHVLVALHDSVQAFQEDGTWVRCVVHCGASSYRRSLDVHADRVVVSCDVTKDAGIYRASDGACVGRIGDYNVSGERQTGFMDICLCGDLVFAVDNSDRVVVLSAHDGAVVGTLGGRGLTTSARGVCLSPDGVLYVCCEEGLVSFLAFD